MHAHHCHIMDADFPCHEIGQPVKGLKEVTIKLEGARRILVCTVDIATDILLGNFPAFRSVLTMGTMHQFLRQHAWNACM